MRIPLYKVLWFAVVVAGCMAGCQKQKPAPSIQGLSDALQMSAEKAIPVPSLADEQIIIPDRPGIEDTPEVEHLFATAGATAVSSIDSQGRVSIMGDVPEVNVEALKAALRHERATMEPGPYTSTRLIEVLIENTAASPSP
jgi:hypothetical protein